MDPGARRREKGKLTAQRTNVSARSQPERFEYVTSWRQQEKWVIHIIAS